jgi:hypothetical protein
MGFIQRFRGTIFYFYPNPFALESGVVKIARKFHKGDIINGRSYIDRTEARLAPDSVKLYGAVEYGAVQMYSAL